jgi:hypothetical protein
MSTAAIPNRAAEEKPLSGLALPAIGVGVAILLIVLGTLLARRRDEQLPTIYGRRRGTEAGKSVNGTAVLAEMFRAQGNRVTTATRLSPRLDKVDVIVWVPSDFAPPTTEQRDFLEGWLANGSGRTVVYVGRDYDAALDYWDRVVPAAPAEKASEMLRRQAEAKAAAEAARSKMPTESYARWFTARRDEKKLDAVPLEGPWAEDIDSDKADLHIEGRLAIPVEEDRASKTDDEELPDEFEVLLGTREAPLVYRVVDDTDYDAWPDSQLIVVANGSFVLNYPLVNREHRKLAARLVAECGEGQKVVFIESGEGGPAVLDKEPTGGLPTALELLKIWPLNAILLHLTVLGIVLCLARSPIFGRPRELPADPSADFGKHIEALGKLLARTKDRTYAQARLAQYRQIGQRRSGKSHLK